MPSPLPTFSAVNFTNVEEIGFVYKGHRSAYATSDGKAIAGTDYTATSGTLSWAAGEKTPQTITVTILSNPAAEPAESLNLPLSIPTGGATLGTPHQATLTVNEWVNSITQPPVIRPTLSGPNFQMGFTTTNGKTYRLLQNTSTPRLTDANWTFTGQQFSGNGSTQSFTVPKPSTGVIFYIVEVN